MSIVKLLRTINNINQIKGDFLYYFLKEITLVSIRLNQIYNNQYFNNTLYHLLALRVSSIGRGLVTKVPRY